MARRSTPLPSPPIGSAADPANGSPSQGIAASIESMEATDEVTLAITLATPNAHFDKAIARSGLNYIASAQAIADGVDLTNEAVGAGPFLLESWTRDDRMELERNPNWF